jgi:hypothetical protein
LVSHGCLIGAYPLFPGLAGPTLFTGHRGNNLDSITLAKVHDTGAAGNDDPCDFVTDDLGRGEPGMSVLKNLGIGSTCCARHHSNLELSRLRFGTIDLFNHKLPGGFKNGGLHDVRFLSLTVT